MQTQTNPNPKKGETMAKKKGKGPTRECESCGKSYHPARNECPHCGTANAAKSKKKKTAKKKSTNGRRKVAAGGDGDSLVSAINFIESAGGFHAAKAALEQIERIKNL